jgi:hypothetical protein
MGRGGKRKGAGAPKKHNAKVPLGVTVIPIFRDEVKNFAEDKCVSQGDYLEICSLFYEKYKSKYPDVERVCGVYENQKVILF